MARGRVWSVSCWPQRRLRTIQCIEGQLPAQPVVETVKGRAVVFEVLFHAGKSLGSLFVVAKGLRRLVEGDLGTEPVGDVGQVAEGRRVVPLRISAFRSSALRLRTAATKLPKCPLPDPRFGSTLMPSFESGSP